MQETVATSTADQPQLCALAAQLAHLKQQAPAYHPPRLRFIESLLQRAGETRQAVAQRLAAKAQRALATYQQEWSSAKAAAAAQLQTIQTQQPACFGQAQQHFEQGNFAALQRPSTGQNSPASPLRALIKSLAADTDTDDNASLPPPSLDILMAQQEAAIVAAEGGQESAAMATLAPVSDLPQAQSKNVNPPLKANLRYQHGQRQQQLNHFMATVLAAKPTNPGPLNPERLAIELLREMHALSPAYMQHCLLHFETLLWLGDI